MTSTIINQFNIISLDFMKQTEKITGKSYINQFRLATGFNNMIAIEMYIKNILPYKHYIYKKDERFFINMNVNNSYMNYFTDINILKEKFTQLDTETKNNIWEYIQALTILADDLHEITQSNKSST